MVSYLSFPQYCIYTPIYCWYSTSTRELWQKITIQLKINLAAVSIPIRFRFSLEFKDNILISRFRHGGTSRSHGGTSRTKSTKVENSEELLAIRMYSALPTRCYIIFHFSVINFFLQTTNYSDRLFSSFLVEAFCTINEIFLSF